MKYLLLAKSNIRKTKGLTVGLFLLIALAACFLNVFLLINFDFNKNARNVAHKLNTEDVYYLISGDKENITKEYLKDIAKDEYVDLEINNVLSVLAELPYNDGVVTANVVMGTEDLFNNRIGKYEVLESDDTISENYIYLPYQFNTGGGYNLGDVFEFKILKNEYSFKIKGFINTITLGSNNTGAYGIIFDDNSYDNIKENSDGLLESILVKYKIKDDVNATKFLNKVSKQILIDNPHVNVISSTLDDAISARTLLSVVFGALLLIVCVIVLLIVVLMIANNISNFIRENIKTLGALKAIGYTTKDLTISFISQFMIIDVMGCVFGIVLSKYLMQLIGNIMVLQSAIPYTSKFILSTIFITFIVLSLIVFVTLLLLLRKAKKIEPIVALREGLTSKNLNKNTLPFERSNLPVTLNLAIKTTFNNMGQNITTAIIVFFLIMMSSLSLVLYQNFSVNPKVSIMTFETCDGIVGTDSDDNKEIINYLKNHESIENARLVAMNNINIDDARLVLYVIDDTDSFQNRDAVYKGDFPKNNNEIALSGKFASIYGYEIGDEVEVQKGSNKKTFKLVGFIQSLNNNGMESMLMQEAAEEVIGTQYDKMYYFDVKNDYKTKKVFDDLKEKFGNQIKSTMDFEELKEGALGTFGLVASLIVILVFIINLLVILLVLYMLIKTLINKKQKDYGILKALGYTSKQIILQNAFSFLPSIIVSVVLASIVSVFTMDTIIGTVMNLFGIMKLSLDIPILLIAIMGVIFILLSLILAILLSRKIKKIEPYKLLIGE